MHIISKIIHVLALAIIGMFCLNLYNGKTGWGIVGVQLSFSTIVFIHIYAILGMKKELKTREHKKQNIPNPIQSVEFMIKRSFRNLVSPN